ncbi:hypothetical protein K438DRAFT_1750810 [Mycena galopus ATCC 62051]|nr:hypothetical protein K438DRAFT_1750810 [Mycena galopus ATCC 62051]
MSEPHTKPLLLPGLAPHLFNSKSARRNPKPRTNKKTKMSTNSPHAKEDSGSSDYSMLSLNSLSERARADRLLKESNAKIKVLEDQLAEETGEIALKHHATEKLAAALKSENESLAELVTELAGKADALEEEIAHMRGTYQEFVGKFGSTSYVFILYAFQF